MAEIKPQVYRDERPAEYFDRFHERTRRGEPGLVYEAVRACTGLVSVLFYRLRAHGLDNVPVAGPVILAPNHFSQMDHFFSSIYLRRRVQFMAKSQIFGPPVLTSIFTHGGVFPIRRGNRDDEAFKTVRAILDRGGVLLVYAEGGRSRTRSLGEPKAGLGKIALETGVPVVPVAIHGSAGVRGFRRLRFPKVRIQYGEPMSFPVEPDANKDRHLEVSVEVFDRVRAMYAELEREAR